MADENQTVGMQATNAMLSRRDQLAAAKLAAQQHRAAMQVEEEAAARLANEQAAAKTAAIVSTQQRADLKAQADARQKEEAHAVAMRKADLTERASRNAEFNQLIGDIKRASDEQSSGPISKILETFKQRPVTSAVGAVTGGAAAASSALGLNPKFTASILAVGGTLTALSGGMGSIAKWMGQKREEKKLGLSKEEAALFRHDPMVARVAETNKTLAVELAKAKVAMADHAAAISAARIIEMANDTEAGPQVSPADEPAAPAIITSELEPAVQPAVAPAPIVPDITVAPAVAPAINVTPAQPQLAPSVELNASGMESQLGVMVERMDQQTQLNQTLRSESTEAENEWRAETRQWRGEVITALNAPAASDTAPAEKSGLLSTLMGSLPSIGKLFGGLGPKVAGWVGGIGKMLGGVFTSVGPFLRGLITVGKSLLRFAGPIGLVVTLLMALDFEKDLVQPIKRILDVFASGNWIEGIARILTMPQDIIAKGLLRAVSWVAELFGADELAATLSSIADNFNLVDMISTAVTGMITSIATTINSIISGLAAWSVKVPDWVPAIGGKELKPFSFLEGKQIPIPATPAPKATPIAKAGETKVEAAPANVPPTVAPTITSAAASATGTVPTGPQPQAVVQTTPSIQPVVRAPVAEITRESEKVDKMQLNAQQAPAMAMSNMSNVVNNVVSNTAAVAARPYPRMMEPTYARMTEMSYAGMGGSRI